MNNMKKEPKEIKYTSVKCPSCGKTHPVSPAQLLVQLSLEGKTDEQLKARTAKATKASAIARSKRAKLKKR